MAYLGAVRLPRKLANSEAGSNYIPIDFTGSSLMPGDKGFLLVQGKHRMLYAAHIEPGHRILYASGVLS